MERATEKMRQEGLPEVAIETFARYEKRLRAGEAGMLPRSRSSRSSTLPSVASLPDGRRARDRARRGAQAERRPRHEHGDDEGQVAARGQARAHLPRRRGAPGAGLLRERHGAPVPLLLMNSFATREDTLAALAAYPGLEVDGLPLDFLQSKVPKLLAEATSRSTGRPPPASSGRRPGHGEVFASLASSGLAGGAARARLRASRSSRTRTTSAPCSSHASWPGSRARGCRSSWSWPTARRGTARAGTSRGAAPTAASSCARSAQVPDEDQEAFEDVSVHRYFNCNNIWVSLRALGAGACRARRCARAADDREPQDGRPGRPSTPPR